MKDNTKESPGKTVLLIVLVIVGFWLIPKPPNPGDPNNGGNHLKYLLVEFQVNCDFDESQIVIRLDRIIPNKTEPDVRITLLEDFKQGLLELGETHFEAKIKRNRSDYEQLVRSKLGISEKIGLSGFGVNSKDGTVLRHDTNWINLGISSEEEFNVKVLWEDGIGGIYDAFARGKGVCTQEVFAEKHE